jgi:effector-binding domain-containing protein
MSVTPEITERPEQPYVAIRAQVPMRQLGEVAHRIGDVFGWLAAHGLAPAGPPFFRYLVIDMERQLEVEAGVPVTTVVAGDDQVISGVLPAGRYATVIHVGPPDSLVGATAALLEWAADSGLQWDMTVRDDDELWGARLEFYLTDPSEQPDTSKWETQLAFRLADIPN